MSNLMTAVSAWFDRVVWRPLANSFIEDWLGGDEPSQASAEHSS